MKRWIKYGRISRCIPPAVGRIGLLLSGLCVVCSIGYAQYVPLFNQTEMVRSFYNPAYVGQGSEMLLTSAYHHQWAGVQGAPQNALLMIDAPLKLGRLPVGVGGTIVAQRKGLFVNTSLAVQASSRFKWGKTRWAVGIQAGLLTSMFDGTKLFIPDGEGMNPNDPALPLTRVSARAFDSAVGIQFNYKGFELAVAGQHLFRPHLAFEYRYDQYLPITINFATGYNFQSDQSLLEWNPHLFASTDLNTYRIDVNLGVTYAKRYEFGLVYRVMQAAGFRFGMKWSKLRLGYAFSMPISQLALGNYGTHELVLSYAIPITKNKSRDARYKSILLL